MKNSHFFAMLSRMKLIGRWGLMHNTVKEDISQHSAEVAMLAHALAVLRNTRFGGDISPERVCLLALYHDAPEILTGDLPTPVKYFNPKIKEAYKEVERVSAQKLLSLLPDDLLPFYEDLFFPKGEEALWALVKAADKLAALIKCIEERKSGNHEFDAAYHATLALLADMNLPEVNIFLEECIPSYSLPLDELE